jgi:hypothetical protein
VIAISFALSAAIVAGIEATVAGEFVRNLHQDVRRRIAGTGVEDEIEFKAVPVANDRDIILGPAHQLEPQGPVERQSAVEIAHPNADVIYPFDGDCLGHCDLPWLDGISSAPDPTWRPQFTARAVRPLQQRVLLPSP